MDLNDLIYEILCALGFSLDESSNTIIDQENGNPIDYNGKNLKFSFNGPFLMEENELWFDPIHDEALSERLYKLYAINQGKYEGLITVKVKEAIDNCNRHALSAYTINTDNEKEEHTTNFYNNRSLMFLDMILEYSSVDNLYHYDV